MPKVSRALPAGALAVGLLLCVEGFGRAQAPSFGVDFSVTPGSGTHRTEYTFTAVPVGGSAPYAYIWNFGDGGPTEPTTATVRHTFYRPGTYTVQLTGRDGSGQVVVTRKPFVVGTTELAVDCEVIGLSSGVAPLRVELRATPENCVGPCGWKWESGDGQVVLGQNYAEFDYRHAGTFRAKVTLEDALTFTPEHYERRATCEQVIRLSSRGEPGPGGGPFGASSRYAYATVAGSDVVSAFTVNSATGSLSANGTAAAGDAPTSLAATPSGRFLYVGNLTSNDLSAYAIDPATGTLTSLATVPTGTAAFSSPFVIGVHPNGQFVYVSGAQVARVIQGYSIGASGLLTNIFTTPVSAPAEGVLDPLGRFLFLPLSPPTNAVQSFSVDAVTGALSSTATTPACNSPRRGAVDHSGQFLYVPCSLSNDVAAYSIHPTTGALTAIGTFPGGDAPRWAAVHPTRRLLYVANLALAAGQTPSVSIYSISGSGALTSAGTQTLPDSPFTITLDPSGNVAYVSTNSSILVYAIDAATGALALQSTVPGRHGQLILLP